MQATDFEYDGQCLSDYGFIICDFNFSDGAYEVSAGSVITFNKVSRNQGAKYSLTSTQYDECITTSFDICKDPDIYDHEDMEITEDEFTGIMRWLNRREFLTLCFMEDKDYEKRLCYYQASFNVSKIKIRDKLFGIRLTMETDRPFGVGKEQIIKYIFSEGGESKILNDVSDEIGSICPTIIVKCNADGKLEIDNEQENCTTIIENCKVGEIITLHGDTQIIESSLDSHDVCDDFNYSFFRIGNNIGNRKNVITSSLPCEMTIKYSPIIKDSP